MLGRLRRAYGRWRERRRQYAIKRALYRAGGGEVPHHHGSRFGPPAATHMPDIRDQDDE